MKNKKLVIIVSMVVALCIIAGSVSFHFYKKSSKDNEMLNDRNRIGTLSVEMSESFSSLQDIEKNEELFTENDFFVKNNGDVPNLLRVNPLSNKNLLPFVKYSTLESEEYYTMDSLGDHVKNWIYVSPNDEKYGKKLGGYLYYMDMADCGEKITIFDGLKVDKIPDDILSEVDFSEGLATVEALYYDYMELWKKAVTEKCESDKEFSSIVNVDSITNNEKCSIVIRVVSDYKVGLKDNSLWDYKEKDEYYSDYFVLGLEGLSEDEIKDRLNPEAYKEYSQASEINKNVDSLEHDSCYYYIVPLKPGETLNLPKELSGSKIEYIKAEDNVLEIWADYVDSLYE